MYRVIAYSNYKKEDPIIIHEPQKYGNKILQGVIDQELNTINLFDFTIAQNNTYYRLFSPLVTIVSVVDLDTDKVEFEGRVAKDGVKMSSNGHITQTITIEDKLSYLHDSTQDFMSTTLINTKDYLQRLINNHNQQVEPHKHFILRNVTADTSTGKVYRSIGYEDTFDTIKDKLMDRLGGYLVYEEIDGKLYLDYLAEYGVEDDTPIQIARNLQEATKETAPDGLATVIVPLGAEIETGKEETEAEKQDSDFSRQRVTIESVNGGSRELVDTELVKIFGRLSTRVDFPNASDKTYIKNQGLQYLKNQRILLVTWDIGVVELGLIDHRYGLFKLGNHHIVHNPLLSGNDRLQITAKKIDVVKPQKTLLTIGNQKKTLSQYQNQLGSQQKPIEVMKERVKANTADVAGVKETTVAQSTELVQVKLNLEETQTLATTVESGLLETNTEVSNLSQSINAAKTELQAQIDELKGLVEANKKG